MRLGRVLRLAIPCAVVATATIVATGGTHNALSQPGLVLQAKSRTQPLPTSGCVSATGTRCYSPAQFAKAYRLDDLAAGGIDGSGQTIAIVDSFGSPTIRKDLHRFDQTFGVSNPSGVPLDPAIAQDPKLTIIQPAGHVPAFTSHNSDMVGWAEETTLDVEWAHVMAPKANILLVETPTSETEGTAGFPDIVKAENYVIKHRLASVISESFGATENTFPTRKSLLKLRSAFINAQRRNITVLGASGDSGSTDYQLNLRDLYTMRVNSWPSSDPLVTSIGGTQLNLDDSGSRLSPDVVWNDRSGASGGGPSHVFKRPPFQNGDKSVVGKWRGTPDVSLSAAVDGGVWVYYSFLGTGSPYHVFGGTSAASPEFAGVVAMADQIAGHPIGVINNALYKIPYGGGLVDITSGNNDIGPFMNSNGKTYHVRGFNARTGYDLASGLGTIDPARFVAALANGATKPPVNVKDVTCTGTMSFASILGNLVVPNGATCTLTDSVVRHDAHVAGSLTLDGSTIGHDVVVATGGTFAQNTDSAGEPSIVQGKVITGP
jgi:subtilase family serine protease